MDWIKRMNSVMNYIEDNLTDDLDYNQIAKIACCPNYQFQRMFVFITEISLSEYIRRRRLTLAAFDLQQNNNSIIEIAQKYGYESHSAFTRAFSDMHGISPSSARKPGAKLTAHPPISFQNSVMGGSEMNYRIEKKGAFSAVGVKYSVNTENATNSIPMIWQKARQNGIADKLFDLMNENSSKSSNAVFGILSEGNWGENDVFSYYVAVPHEKETPVDMAKLSFPESLWVVFEASALVDIAKTWKQLYTDWIPTSGYFLADLPAIECYYTPGHKPQNELWISIVKK